MNFAQLRIDNFDQLSSHTSPGFGWIFRGMMDADWRLQTSLERCCDRRGIVAMRRRDVEERLCKEFRRAYHEFGVHVPRKESRLEWLALMRHYGGPTRLIDFSYSIFVAAYFALEQAETDCAIWRIHGPWALQQSVAALEAAGVSAAQHLGRPFDEHEDEIFSDIFLRDPNVFCACPATPFRLNERLRVQMGCFMVPARVDVPFEDNLNSLPGSGDATNILKLVIPHQLINESLHRLFDMGISRRSLFPGLDGLAQSLAVYSPAFNPIPWSATRSAGA